MPDLRAPDYQLARLAIERGLGLLYLVAFVVAARQFPALCGERGLEPAPRILHATTFWQHWKALPATGPPNNFCCSSRMPKKGDK